VRNPGARRAQRAAHVTVDAFEQLAKATAARFIVRGGDEWPGGLDDLRHAEREHPATRWRAVWSVATCHRDSDVPTGLAILDEALAEADTFLA
jgi:hypothetical protein